MRRTWVGFVLAFALGSTSRAHDIPSARVDRSIQGTLSPGKLRVEYEVSLSELTLAQDFRQLVGELPETDRAGLFDAYARQTAPLNARGLLVEVDGSEIELKPAGFDVLKEGHPIFVFRFEADVPPRGRLSINDTNFSSGEGTSRLALRPDGPVAIRGDDLPTDVLAIPIRTALLLTDAEERRTKRLRVDYGPSAAIVPPVAAPAVAPEPGPSRPASTLSRLLDGAGHRAWPFLLATALLLGAGHAIQPGHGKTLVAASALGPGGGPLRGAALGLATATAHLGSVAGIAGLIWVAGLADLGGLDRALAHAAGFAIGAVGCWRVGHHLAGFGPEGEDDGPPAARLGARRVIALGLAGGAVPCWDAVALVVVSAAIGRLALGLALLAAFSLGMAAVLVAVGALANRFRAAFEGSERADLWERRLGVLGGAMLAVIGVSLLAG